MGTKMTAVEQEEHDRQVQEYFEKGGTITKCGTGEFTEGAMLSVWRRGPGRPKKEEVAIEAAKKDE